MTPITEYREESYQADGDGCWPVAANRPLEPGIIRVLYVNGVPGMCEFLCPCGCESPCLALFPTAEQQRTPHRPLWNFAKGSHGPTISPSIRYLGGCKAHFNITDGKVVMHGDSGK